MFFSCKVAKNLSLHSAQRADRDPGRVVVDDIQSLLKEATYVGEIRTPSCHCPVTAQHRRDLWSRHGSQLYSEASSAAAHLPPPKKEETKEVRIRMPD